MIRPRRGTSRDVRRTNRAVLLRTLFFDGPRAQAGVDPGRVLGVGVPGMVRGSVVDSPTFGWSGVRLADMLPGLPVFVDNGAMTLGLAEHWFGAGRGSDYMIMVLIGSGVGACIITDGITVRGVSGGAGEWGHTTVIADGRPCRCGARGCLEAYVGAESVLARAGIDLAGVEEESAFAALLADPGARPLFDEAVGHLGAGLASLINLLNPERIVLSVNP
ncbi:ROK family protein [Nonomuraea sp. NPDC003707]